MTFAAADATRGVHRPMAKHQHIPLPPGARRGAGAPWYDLSIGARRFDAAGVIGAFENLAPPEAAGRAATAGRPGAAVLAPIYDDGGEAWVILTRRAAHLRTHRGEVSFPGGRQEPGESLEQTARRETIEEIALAEPVRIVGELDHLSTITSSSVIVPYVGVLDAPPVGLVANPGEVEAILRVPLSRLLDPRVFRSEIWPFPGGNDYPVYFFDLDEDTVWGATAAMLWQLLGFLTGTVRRGELHRP